METNENKEYRYFFMLINLSCAIIMAQELMFYNPVQEEYAAQATFPACVSFAPLSIADW